jgi:D-3-phosphoglycerate dehydrogenase
VGEAARVVVVGKNWKLFDEATKIIEDAGGVVDHLDSMDPDKIADYCRDASAIMAILAPIPAQVVNRLRQCTVIVRVGVGFDSVDVETARARGIAVCNVPDYCTDEVADHTLALTLALTRAIPQLDRAVRLETWKPSLPYPIHSFENLTFGVLGFGRIGRAAIQRARAFEYRLAACDPYVDSSIFSEEGVARMDLDTLTGCADVLSLHCPLTPETDHLFDAARLSKMKSGAILINTARGAIVDNHALAEALSSGRLAAAGIDVFEQEPLPPDHPLLASPNALLTPHYAWNSTESEHRLHRRAAEEVARALRGQPLRCPVT